MCLFEGEGDVRERVFFNEVEYALYFLEKKKIGVTREKEKKKLVVDAKSREDDICDDDNARHTTWRQVKGFRRKIKKYTVV